MENNQSCTKKQVPNNILVTIDTLLQWGLQWMAFLAHMEIILVLPLTEIH